MTVGSLTLAVAFGLLVYFGQNRQSSPTAGMSSSGAPLNLAVVGQPAPGFSLMDQYEQPYTLNPGDGKNHLLVFYMGNF
jgi:cytochrome oxidase Cu insertion factor (SCO1/SenC/PrrC family)